MRLFMNRAKKQLTAKEKKRQDKETRSPLQPSPPEGAATTWKILEKFPKIPAKKGKEQLDSSMKGIKAKKKKLHSKHSKRTTPGEVEADITPYAHIHPEGKKIITGREKQSAVKAKSLNKKLSKVKK